MWLYTDFSIKRTDKTSSPHLQRSTLSSFMTTLNNPQRTQTIHNSAHLTQPFQTVSNIALLSSQLHHQTLFCTRARASQSTAFHVSTRPVIITITDQSKLRSRQCTVMIKSASHHLYNPFCGTQMSGPIGK